ncbi:MAG: hypothetical protein WCG04_00450 [Alphaproteobacteria bacterium]
MSDISDSFKKMLGRDPSDQEMHQMYRVRDALGLKNNDALWVIIMALQHYQNLYAAIPQSISTAAKTAAGSAAVQATANVNNAVAALVPTVEKAVEAAAAGAINRVQVGKSLITVCCAVLLVGGIFVFGMCCGSHLYDKATRQEAWDGFWSEIRWGVGVGLAAPALLFGGFLVSEEDRPVGHLMHFGGFILFAILAYKMLLA